MAKGPKPIRMPQPGANKKILVCKTVGKSGRDTDDYVIFDMRGYEVPDPRVKEYVDNDGIQYNIICRELTIEDAADAIYFYAEQTTRFHFMKKHGNSKGD